MSVKLLAMGNVLMGDDGIAVYVAASLEEQLNQLGIEVIYGETDIGYSIAMLGREDFIIILDAARLGKTAGETNVLSFDNYSGKTGEVTQHNISFLELIRLYFPQNKGFIITIEIDEIRFHYGAGRLLEDKLAKISLEIYEKIKHALYQLEVT